MNSKFVLNLSKVDGAVVSPRLWDDKIKNAKLGMPEGGTLAKFDTRKEQQGTDYKSPNPLNNVPLKLRERYARTEWPVRNHENPSSKPDNARNWGHQVWRRYPDGNLDVRSSFQMLVEAIRRYKEAPALNEIDALILSSALPGFKFSGLPQEIVEIKAYLSPREKKQLFDMLTEAAEEQPIRDIVDFGGA